MQIKFRYTVISTFILILFGILVSRLYYLQVKEKNFLQSQGDARTIRVVTQKANRGIIRDRNNEPLAVSVEVNSVWVDPTKFDEDLLVSEQLFSILELDKIKIKQKIKLNKNKEFLYLKRHVTNDITDKIKQLNIKTGLYLMPEYKRYYPQGKITSHVLGFTDLDHVGREGIELAFNDWLSGTDGSKKIIKDRTGKQVECIEEYRESQVGKDLVLSIDKRLQYLAYDELQKAVNEHRAISGTAVVLDINTGEVLAMVNEPTYNPNYGSKNPNSNNYRNKAVTDSFEPGSTMKAFSMVSILENNRVNEDTLIDTNPGIIKVQGSVVRDVRNYGVMKLGNVLKNSSNIAISKYLLQSPASALLDVYDRVGFGFSTGSNFPGESLGVLNMPDPKQKFVLATMGFGYGVSVTPLQLAKAYAVLGADGIKKPISMLKVENSVSGVRVISSKISRQVLGMLSSINENNNSKARVKGYRVAGKTGTARILDKNGYQSDRHQAIFAGIAPVVNPKFSIVVLINEPKNGKYYSNQVAAPVFSKIAEGALRLFDIKPDLLDTQGVHVVQNGNTHS